MLHVIFHVRHYPYYSYNILLRNIGLVYPINGGEALYG